MRSKLMLWERGTSQEALQMGLIPLGKHTVAPPAFLLPGARDAEVMAGAPGTTFAQMEPLGMEALS